MDFGCYAGLDPCEDDQLVIRRDGEQQTVDISTPGAIAQSTGWDLPLQALGHWLKGLPYTGTAVQALELTPDKGLLQTLYQDAWEVSYQRYRDFQALALPTRLTLKRGDTEVRVVITQGQVSAG